MLYSPSTIVHLCNVPISPAQKHQLSFGSTAAQYNYFIGRRVVTYENFSFQRKDEVIRIPANVESLGAVNYCFYQNANFGSKWFYCFVTEKRYINDNCTELKIKTDVFQTYQFDFHFGGCYVERQHTQYDNLGEWNEPEPFNVETFPIGEQQLSHNGAYYNQNIILYFSKNPPSLSGVLETDEDSGAYSATWYKMYYVAGSVSQYQACLQDIATLESAGEMELICGIGTSFNDQYNQQFDIDSPVIQIPAGGVAKNNKTKLYCYSMIVGASSFKVDILTAGGETINVTSRLNGGSNPFVSCEITNISGHPIIEYNSFPIPRIPINSDINNISRSLRISLETLPFQILSGGIGAAASAAMGGGGGFNASSLVSPLQSMITTAGNYAISDIMPKQLSGYSPGNGRFSAERAGIYQIYYAPTREEFNKIDDFFTAYGYAINAPTIPNFRTRANHNYLKTNDCLILSNGGDFPAADDMKELQSIFDNGVTVWHNPATMGNYSVDNSPV